MIFNNLYLKKKSKTLDFLKRLRELIFALLNNNFTRPNGTVFIYPFFPSRKSTIYKISRHLKFNLISYPIANTKFGILFNDATFTEPLKEEISIPLLNNFIYDISKKNVDKKHQEIFGYNTTIDPITFIGKCVIKSDENALHDGEIIDCPINKKDPRKIYQIIIDNQEGDLYVDYRVCVMKYDIVIVYKKFKDTKNRFSNNTCDAQIIDTNQIPCATQKNIILFCHKMQSDFCELDVLKDNNTGKWFIIDLNKTPYGPPASLSKKDKKKAVEILSNGFAKNFFN